MSDQQQPHAAADAAMDAPWTVEYDADVVDVDHGPIVSWPCAIKPVVSLIEFAPGVNEEEVAHLMAAAPLLRDALRYAIEETEDGLHQSPCDIPDCWVERAEAALAAARPPDDEVPS